MKKNLLSFLALAIAVSAAVPARAEDYTVFEDATTKSVVVPICLSNGNGASAGSFYGSITQQIYLASELSALGASAGDITSLTFYYSASNADAEAVERDIVIYLMASSFSEYEVEEFPRSGYGKDYQSYFLCDDQNKAGLKVYSGKLSTEGVSTSEIKEKKLNFNVANFPWNGTSNIVMTVVDKTASTHDKSNLKFIIGSTKTGVSPSQTNHPRFAHTLWTNDSDERVSWITDGNYNFSGKKADVYGNSNNQTGQEGNRSWVNKVKFSISVPVVPDVPTGLVASSVGTTSASLSWNEASGAVSYKLYYSADGTNYNELASPATNSYNWTGLTASTTYYVKVSAVNGVGKSALSEPISFTTQAQHTHEGITFEPWSNASAMPTSGNYYLNTDVELASDWNVTENINLCLNGHEVYIETNSIQIKDGATFAIYDNEGGGRIYGYFVADYPKYGLINIENGGTLVLSEGTIQNLYGSYEEDDDPDDKSLSNAIYNNGTLKLSGALTFTSYHADIYLGSNKYITIESEKPLTNSEPYSVYKSGKSVITSGWANMNGADPKDYFVSANTSLNIKMGETEAEFYPVISLSEKNTNTAIGTYSGQMVDVSLTRSLTSAQYNTFCLPFALTDAQLQSVFGSGYDLQELTASSLTGETLNLEFTKCTDLEAGKPYLLQPSVNVTNPVFEGVTITATSPGTSSTTYVDYKAVYSPTSLEGGNRNLLFLGADNELFWPEATGNLNGFRAYFEIKGAAAQAAKRARISMGGKIATGNISPTLPQGEGVKILRDGKLYLMYKGQMYDVQGKRI